MRVLQSARLFQLLVIALTTAVTMAVLLSASAVLGPTEQAMASIGDAERTESAMAGMDADAAEELLTQAPEANLAPQRFEAHRVKALVALTQAAEQSASSDAERLPLQGIAVGLSTYEGLIQRTRDLHADEDAGTVSSYATASAMMKNDLWPLADSLEQESSRSLVRAEDNERRRLLFGKFVLGLLVLVCTGLSAAVQVSLSQRTHRVFNVPLLAATLAVFAGGTLSLGAMSHFRVASEATGEEITTDMPAYLRASATAYKASKEESLKLLDPAHAADHERARLQALQTVAVEPPDVAPADLLAALRNSAEVPGFSGLLAEQIASVLYPGERDAALNAFSDWERYVLLRGGPSSLDATGVHRPALALRTAAQGASADEALNRFEAAEEDALQLRQQGIRGQLQAERHSLRHAAWISCSLYGLGGALVVLGFAPRVREYR